MSSPPTYGDLPVVIDPTAWDGRVYSPALPNTIDAIQQLIAATLAAGMTAAGLDIPVYVWNNFDLDTWWASSAIAFILISYQETDASTPLATSAMLQDKTLRFKIHVEARTKCWALTGNGSVYQLIEAIIAYMSGVQYQGCKKAYFTNESFSEQDPQGRVWLYDMTYNVITKRVLQPTAYGLVNLAKIINNVQPGGDVVVVEPDENPPET